MDSRRLACVLLGAWLGCSLFMTAVATTNFRLVDQLLDLPTVPAAAKQFQALGHNAARHLMRHQASEINRYFFEAWGLMQIVLGLSVLGVIVFGVRARATQLKIMLGLAGFALLLVFVNQFIITPTIIGVGRVLDFSEPGQFTAERSRFWNYHKAYSTLEVAKMLTCAALAALLLAGVGKRRRSTRGGDEEDEVRALDLRRERMVSH
jgi:hypothetical protein